VDPKLREAFDTHKFVKLRWGFVEYDSRITYAAYECKDCGTLITESPEGRFHGFNHQTGDNRTFSRCATIRMIRALG